MTPGPLLGNVGPTMVGTALPHFKNSRSANAPRDRLEAVRKASIAFREEMLSGAPVPYYASFDLIRVPYYTRYAFRDACKALSPMIHILNRMFIVQFRTSGGLKTLLVSPSDAVGNRETPFFKSLSRSAGPFESWVTPILAPEIDTVDACLARAGLRPEDVDFITYDHLHTQDLRRWLGSGDRAGFFPNAKLLVMRQEWQSAHGLLPIQQRWYCPRGTEGVPMEKVVLLEGDTLLGEGVALIHTPGHTEGNHSIVVHTPEGLMVTSENGVAADSYAPLKSSIPGLRRFARETGIEVILNANTLEGSIDQYLSMVQEKTIAGPSARNPEFHNVVPSSELASYWLFPGIRPSFEFGSLQFGTLTKGFA